MSPMSTDDLVASTIHAFFAELQAKSYSHWCPTPETQEFTMKKRAKLNGKDPLTAKSVNDIWAWSLPVTTSTIGQLHSTNLVPRLIEAGILVADGQDMLRPTIRVSNFYPLGRAPNYYAHASWPTSDIDSVFFGPDSYRYTRYMNSRCLSIGSCRVAIDMCTGAGVGAIHLARQFPGATVYGLDINEKAIKLARVNAAHLCPAVPVERLQMLCSDGFAAVQDRLAGQVDVIAIDPPFIADEERTYARGGYLGIEFTLDMLRKSLPMLRAGGEAWLHMAAPITLDGRDLFREGIEKLEGFEIVDYDVIDVDIFGNEMGNPNAYRDVGSLASVGVVLRKPRA